MSIATIQIGCKYSEMRAVYNYIIPNNERRRAGRTCAVSEGAAEALTDRSPLLGLTGRLPPNDFPERI